MAGTKKIECYIDCGSFAYEIVGKILLTGRQPVSPYSFYALTYLRNNGPALQALGAEVEFIPVFLGGIMVGSGNTPPWKNPVKARYSPYDSKRNQKYFGLKFEVPSFFPIMSLLPQRALLFIKKNYEKGVYEEAFLHCFKTLWENHVDISTPPNLSISLRRVFADAEITEILKGASSPEIKAELTDITKKAVDDLGAFGCPWFWVHDGKGHAEPFFGSDRFHFIWDYLDIPHTDLHLNEDAKL